MAGSDKLIGTLRLDLSQLEAEVNKANQMLKSLGQGVNLDLSKVAMDAIEQKLSALTKAAERYGQSMAQSSSQASGSMSQMKTTITSHIMDITSKIETLNAKTGELRTVMQGLDAVGNKVTEVSRNGVIVSQKTQEDDVRRLVSLYHQLGEAMARATTAGVQGKAATQQMWQQQIEAIQREINLLHKENEELQYHRSVLQAAASAKQALAAATAKAADSSNKTTKEVSEEERMLKELGKEYRTLQAAIRDYRAAMTVGNESGMTAAQGMISAIESQIGKWESNLSKLKENTKEYQQMQMVIERMKTALQGFNQNPAGGAQRGAEQAMQDMKTTMNTIASWATRLIVYRGLRQFWTEAKEFASEYYNVLNEIQVVTLSTDEQMERISDKFKTMATELNVAMTDIAKGAVIFYRQGLDDRTTENYLTWATKFSKVSGTELKDTAEYMTAVLNSMQSLNGDAQRVVDVFTYMGDNAATSGTEIATAMQKAAATADAAGMEFEFLAAAIASVSATTRQAPESIGTAFNTMMARLHSIKQRGFNEEDETKINDVAKALNNVGIALMDSSGQWRDFDTILTEISQRWDTMSDKQQSYIATTMAGVRAQNYFIALMNDMSKGLEGGSKMWQLYQGSMQAAGTVNEKYEVWLNSVEAAQNRLTIATQRMFAAMNSDTVFKGFYSFLAGFVDLMAKGTEVMGGFNIAIAAVVLAMGGLGYAFAKLRTEALLAGQGVFSFFYSTHPIIAAITTVAAVTAAVTLATGALGNWWDEAHKTTDAVSSSFEKVDGELKKVNESISKTVEQQKEWNTKAQEIRDLRDEYYQLTQDTSRTKEENERLETVVGRIVELCPELSEALKGPTEEMKTQKGVLDGLNGSLAEYERRAKEIGKSEAAKEGFANWVEVGRSINESDTILQRRKQFRDQVLGSEAGKALVEQRLGSGLAWVTKDEAEAWAMTNAINDIMSGRNPYGVDAPSWVKGGRADYGAMADWFGIEHGQFTSAGDIQGAVVKAVAYDLEGELVELENKRSQAVSTGRSLLGNFVDYSGLSPVVADRLRQQEAEITSGFGTNTGWGIAGLANELEQASNEARAIQQQIDSNPALNLLMQRVETRKSDYLRLAGGEGSTKEILQAARYYNEAVQEFDTLSRSTLGVMGGDLYKQIAQGDIDLSHATDVVANAGDEFTQRKRLRKSLENGFFIERGQIGDIVEADGVIDRSGLSRRFEQIAQEAPLVWTRMLENEFFQGFVNNITDPSSLDRFSDDYLREQWKAVNNAWSDYFKSGEGSRYLGLYEEADRMAGTAQLKPIEYNKGNWVSMVTGWGTADRERSVPEILSGAYFSKPGGDLGMMLDVYNAMEDSANAFFAEHPDISKEKFTDKKTGVIDYAKWMEAVDLYAVDAREKNVDIALQGRKKMDTDVDNFWKEIKKAAKAEYEERYEENRFTEGTPEYFAELASSITGTGEAAYGAFENIDKLYSMLDDEEFLEHLRSANLKDSDWNVLNKIGINEGNVKNLKKGSAELKEIKKNLESFRVKNMESVNRVLNGTTKAVASLNNGTKDWVTYMKTLNQGISRVTQMQGAYDIVVDKSKEGTEEYTDAMKYLSEQTGMTAQQLSTDTGLAAALGYINGETEVVQNSIAALAGSLLTMSGLTFDPSQIVGGYLALGEGADDAALQVAGLVNAALQLLGAQISFVDDGNGNGHFNVTGISGDFVGKSTNKSSGKGGGGGGGGGGKKDSFSDRLSIITAQMGRSVDKYKEMLERLSLYESMYNDQGELTNVLRVQEQRRQVLIDQQKAYEDILRDMPQLIERAKAEMNKYQTDSDDYKKALSDLQNLEDSYASYTQELIKNRAEQLKNADAMKQTREQIVQIEANLRNTIQSVIMDRNNREKNSLSARISMEGDVLDAIRNRYEKERDEIIETTDLRIESLNKETDALSEALDERKKLAEDRDKMSELTELQDQYARIVADPTRAKEAQSIAKKISDLQEEIGWDTAEREVEAQQKSIDQQLESLEDYEKATNKYYDELLEDPRNFIEEYNRILAGTDAEIIAWLTENSDNYVKATDASRKELLQGWQDTLDELRMYTRTVWDEVEAIINLGDTGIMQFLIENSQEFREANAYGQADLAYGWTDMLEKWHAAYVDTFEDLEYMDFTNTMYEWITFLVAQAKSSGGGGGGKSKASAAYKEAMEAIASGATGAVSSFSGALSALLAGQNMNDFNSTYQKIAEKTEEKKATLGQFASGGLAYGSGLAHLDGTAGMPERVLSPEQTLAFERLVDFLTTPGMVSVPGLNGSMIAPWSNGGAGATFGDINISVESLDSDTDIDNLADRLMDAINDRMTRGMVVGGVAMGY